MAIAVNRWRVSVSQLNGASWTQTFSRRHKNVGASWSRQAVCATSLLHRIGQDVPTVYQCHQHSALVSRLFTCAGAVDVVMSDVTQFMSCALFH